MDIYGQHVTEAQIAFSPDDTITRLLKSIRREHPAFLDLGSRAQDIERILQSFGTVLDAINSIRNHATLAHPNEELLDTEEAHLVVNAVNTILNYLEARLEK